MLRTMLSGSAKGIVGLAVASMLLLPAPGFAKEPLHQPYAPSHMPPNALYMATDALFVRPVLLGFTLLGCGIYVVSLPFSLLGGNTVQAAEYLVAGPARATFTRCLGCTTETR